MGRKRQIKGLFVGIFISTMLVACGKAEVDDGISGTYRGTGIEYSGLTLDLDGDTNYVELKSNGKGKLTLEGQSASLKWKMGDDQSSMTISFEGDDYDATLSDGTLTIDILGMMYSYEGENGAGKSAGNSKDGSSESTEGVLDKLKSLENGNTPY